ncbi:YgiT-type zinc finger protein [Candidatus Micrarchaeota archaeon]|nr:YgiT-type zinc finger protein [Candidatus Micrarchaeota archaeon]
MICPNCSTKMKSGIVKEKYLGHNLGKYDGVICPKCNETLLTEKSVRIAQENARKT